MASFDPPGSVPDGTPAAPFTGDAFKTDARGTAEDKEMRYHSILEEAAETEMADLERSGCVSVGLDSIRQEPVLMFIPSLGFARADKSDATLRRMLLLFIRTADSIVKQSFSICYAHTSLSILSQQPLVYRYYKMLPRAYKKNLQKLYVLHPTQLIRVFFEMGVRWFISDKFYRKLFFVDNIANLQRIVPPALCPLPHALIKQEDDETGRKPGGTVLPLPTSFDASLGTTKLIHQCCEYIRQHGLQRKGIFRISGDEVALILVKTRVQATSYRAATDRTVIIGATGDNEALPPQSEKGGLAESAGSARNNGVAGGSNPGMGSVVVTCVDTVAQVLKMLLRSLPEPLVPFDCFQPLLSAARRFQENRSEADFDATSADILACMPREHRATLEHLLRFLALVAAHSEVNSMDSENLSRVFAPTIMWACEGSDAAAAGGSPEAAQQMALVELTLSKVAVQQLLRRFTIPPAAAAGADSDTAAAAAAAAAATAASSLASSSAAGDGAEVEGFKLNAKMLSRLGGGRTGRDSY